MSPTDLLKYCKDSYDRLQEVSPLIPPELIREFKKKFGGNTELSKPEELNGIDKIRIYADTFTVKNPLRENRSEISLEIRNEKSVGRLDGTASSQD